MWITSGLLFGLSFSRHPFTAENPLVSKLCNVTFLQICSDKQTNSSTSWMAWGWAHFQQIFIFWMNFSFKIWPPDPCWHFIMCILDLGTTSPNVPALKGTWWALQTVLVLSRRWDTSGIYWEIKRTFAWFTAGWGRGEDLCTAAGPESSCFMSLILHLCWSD